jgi:cytochrome P450
VFEKNTVNTFGPDWYWRRKAISRHFTGSSLQKDLENVLDEEIQKLQAILDAKCESGETFKMLDLFSHYTLGIILHIFLGFKFEGDLNRIRNILDSHIEFFLTKMGLPMWLISALGADKKWKKDHQDFASMLIEPIREAIRRGSGVCGRLVQQEPKYDETTLIFEVFFSIFFFYYPKPFFCRLSGSFLPALKRVDRPCASCWHVYWKIRTNWSSLEQQCKAKMEDTIA